MTYKTIGTRIETIERKINALVCDSCGKQAPENDQHDGWFEVSKVHELQYYIYHRVDICPECGVRRLAGIDFEEECIE